MNQQPPSWLKVETEEDNTPLRNISNGNGGVGSLANSNLNETDKHRARILFWTLKAITMLLCILMFATACLGIRKLFLVKLVS